MAIRQSTWSSERRITPAEWTAVETQSGATFAPEHRERIGAVVNWYRESSEEHDAALQPGAIRPYLRAIQKPLTDLHKGLKAILERDPKKHAALRELGKGALIEDRIYLGRAEVDRFRGEVARWLAYATKAMALPQDDIGRPPDPCLDELLAVAHSVFVAAGGRGKFRPTFYATVCGWAGHQPQSREALLKRAQRTLDKTNL